MQTVRQMASGIVYAIVSLLLVIGSLALSLAQGDSELPQPLNPTAPPTSTPTKPPAFEPTATASFTQAIGATAIATQIAPTSTYLFPTSAATARPKSTSSWICGPYAGWVRGYVVETGDTLYRIATLHGITVKELQRANCKTGTVIYAGEILWVPYVLPPATELTVIPTFATPTESASPTATPTATATGTLDP